MNPDYPIGKIIAHFDSRRPSAVRGAANAQVHLRTIFALPLDHRLTDPIVGHMHRSGA